MFANRRVRRLSANPKTVSKKEEVARPATTLRQSAMPSGVVQANPSLVQNSLSASQTSASSASSSGSTSSNTTTTQELVRALENMNFPTMRPRHPYVPVAK
jgi:hypothetical protein